MISIFALLLIALIIIGILKIISVLHHIYFFWKNKGVPYLDAFLVTWKMFAGYMTFADYCEYLYYYFPSARYVGTVVFNEPAVILRDSELIKNIMVKDFEHFLDHRVFVDEKADPLFGKNIFFLRGDRWKEMRNTLSPSFTGSKMKFMFDLISKCSRDFVDYLADHSELCEQIEMKEAFGRYATDVIATSAYGISVNSMKDRDNEFYRRGIDLSKFSSGLSIVIKIVLLRMYPLLGKSIGLTLFPSATSKFFTKIVMETIRKREEQNIIRPDMIHLLMQYRNKKGVHQMTQDDIVAQAFIFFLAGFGNSTALMCYAAHELAVHQDIQDRLREEIRQHLEGNGEITYESLLKMSYMDMVISETLRKYPPVIITERVCTRRYELPPSRPGDKSLILEPNTVMMFPCYSLHRDPKYFPNPNKFDPERFSEENKDNILPYSYLPFGHGPRRCIGDRFALMETKILIAHLLQKFTLKTVEKTVEPIVKYSKDFTLLPLNGFWIGLEKRET